MNLRTCITALALLASPTLAIGTANAAPVVNTYRAVSNFSSGSIQSVTQQFTLAFDPTVSGGPFDVLSYTASTVGSPFNLAPVTFVDGVSPPFGTATPATTITVSAGSISPGSVGFQTFFFIDPATGAVRGGNVPLTPSVFVGYSNGSTSVGTFDVTVSLIASASSVPEPAAWASMIAGIALAGAALRQRRRKGAAVLA